MAQQTLISQLAQRTATFLRHSGLTQSNLCRQLSISNSSLSQFLRGTKGLAPETVIKLCQVLSLSHAEITTKFNRPVRSTQILNLQGSVGGLPARPLQLDVNDTGSWVPGLSGTDPNGSGSIDDIPDADTSGPVWDQSMIDVLRETRGYHRQAVKAINQYINQAKVNAGIVTPTGVQQKFSRR
jgi:transcriptional regulator with XRE-family HTH domain